MLKKRKKEIKLDGGNFGKELYTLSSVSIPSSLTSSVTISGHLTWVWHFHFNMFVSVQDPILLFDENGKKVRKREKERERKIDQHLNK